MRLIQSSNGNTIRGLAATRAGGAGLTIPLTTDPVGQARWDRTPVHKGITAIPTHGKSPVGIVGELTIPIHTDPGVRRTKTGRDRTVSGGRAGAKAAIRSSCFTG